MESSDDPYPYGLDGPRAVGMEKVGLGVFATGLVLILLLLLFGNPPNRVPLYVTGAGLLGMVALSLVRLRRLLRLRAERQEQE